jgi:hypothetical protein
MRSPPGAAPAGDHSAEATRQIFANGMAVTHVTAPALRPAVLGCFSGALYFAACVKTAWSLSVFLAEI